MGMLVLTALPVSGTPDAATICQTLYGTPPAQCITTTAVAWVILHPYGSGCSAEWFTSVSGSSTLADYDYEYGVSYYTHTTGVNVPGAIDPGTHQDGAASHLMNTGESITAYASIIGHFHLVVDPSDGAEQTATATC
ncbi:MAG: hypothetical protein V4510_09260 [bacterium]